MKTVLVTGGASGMGKAVCKTLAENGYFVYSLDINKSDDEIANVKQLIVDVTNISSIKQAYDIISKETKTLDAIINFAGIIMMNSLIEISEEEFVKIFNINLFGVYRINKIFLPMISENKGKIIITTSELAPNKILPFNSIYSISKKALDAYAEGLRMELGLLGIDVITLRPGAVQTNLINSSSSALDKLVANTVMYKGYTNNFKKIVDSQQGGAIPAEKIGKLVLKILNKKKPKFVYTKNASIKLKLLNLVPARMQLGIFRVLLKEKPNKNNKEK